MNKLLKQLDESTVIDQDGRYIFVSEPEFLRLTQDPGICFVCLTAPSSETKEHIVPDWAIRLCDLADKRIMLSNGQGVLYPQYKIPCCKTCNQALQQQYEKPISDAVKRGLKGIKDLHWSDPTLPIRWLNLLYFKTHYNDLRQFAHLDRRKGKQKIGERYDWGTWNLPHALFRAPLYGTSFRSKNLGSLCVFKLVNQNWADVWDYKDDHVTGTVYVRMHDIALLGILNDGGITNSVMADRFHLPRGAYVAQSLEVLTDYQTFNHEFTNRPEYLKNRAEYVKRWDLKTGATEIRVDLPKQLKRAPHDKQRRHELLWRHLETYGELPMNDGTLLKDAKEKILCGAVNFGLKARPKKTPTDKAILKRVERSVIGAKFYG